MVVGKAEHVGDLPARVLQRLAKPKWVGDAGDGEDARFAVRHSLFAVRKNPGGRSKRVVRRRTTARFPRPTLPPTPRPPSRRSRPADARGRPRPSVREAGRAESRGLVESRRSVVTSTSRSRARPDLLKPVVEHVHGGAELPFGQRPRQIAIGRYTDDGARKLSREHQRLVAGAIQRREHACAVGHDDDSVDRIGSRVAAARESPAARRGRGATRRSRRRRASCRCRPSTGCRR